MTDYPGGKKSADQCTYREMVERLWWEINRALRLDLHHDLADAHRANLEAFTLKFRDMEPGETIGDFERRKIATISPTALLQEGISE